MRKFASQNTVNMQHIGNLSLLDDQNIIGITGHREVSTSIYTMLYDYILDISVLYPNAVICTGYANGVDILAAKLALEKGLRYIAVLPYGLISFRKKSELLKIDTTDKMLAISYFNYGEKFSVGNAFARNQHIVDLCSKVVVFGEKLSGGTYDCAKRAVKSGKADLQFSPNYTHLLNTHKNGI